MCGIAGIVGNPNREAVEGMLSTTRHRGPDDQGLYVNEEVVLGMNRLAILDLSQAGHQPMLSSDGRFVIVFNGEVYNFQKERQKLEAEAFKFHSQTDTEVVLNLENRLRSGLRAGSEITFEGVAGALTKEPFRLTLNDGKVLP